MNKWYSIVGIVLVAITASAAEVVKDGVTNQAAVALAPVSEPAQSLTETIELPVWSEFNSRGRRFNDGTVFQPNATLYKSTDAVNFYVNAWANMADEKYVDTRLNENQSTFNEVDLTVGAEKFVNDFVYGIGYIGYIYSGQCIKNTDEVYASVKYAKGINPAATVYYDFKEANGFYGVASVSRIFQIGR